MILSDDWGSVRIRSSDDIFNLKKIGFECTNRFDKFDTLESEEDLEDLFSILLKYKDGCGNHPIITPITNSYNPDFDHIIKRNYDQYKSLTIEETYLKYHNSKNIINIFRDGISEKIFIPQSHGGEHLQVKWWMNEISNPNSFAREALKNHFYFIPDSHLINNNYKKIEAAYNCKTNSDLKFAKKSIESSLKVFKNTFGFSASLFCPPSLIFDKNLNQCLVNNKIEWLDVPYFRIKFNKFLPKDILFNKFGSKYKINLKKLVRNCVFEPNIKGYNLNKTIKEIEFAFSCGLPAIISNHRVNFVGGISKENKKNGLKELDKLLGSVLSLWPDVEFVSVQDL